MRVGSAEPERAHRGSPRCMPAEGQPITHPRIHKEWRAGEVEVRVRSSEVQCRNEPTMPESKQHLVNACDAGRRGCMTDVGLHRSDGAEAALLRPRAERCRQRFKLYGVSELRSRAVRFHITDGG